MIFTKKFRFLLIGLLLPCLIFIVLTATKNSTTAASENEKENQNNFAIVNDPNLPEQIDVRGGTPRGLELRQPTAVQLKAIGSLLGLLNNNLTVRYNGLTATPMSLNNPTGYLTAPSVAAPEQIARDFIRQWREIFRFDETDLNNLKLVSRATTQEGTTVLLFQQQRGNLPVYHGEVLVNVAKSGQIINVGGDSFPRLNVTNASSISPSQAVSAAAVSLGINNFAAQSLGSTQILATYGDLLPEYQTGEKFSGAGVFTDDIKVQQIVFPLGDTGRIAYKFNLTTPQYHGIMWENIVDAQTGEVLRRISLTAYFGEPGGGTGANRRGSFRPDVQNMVEGYNSVGSAQGKVVDTLPASMSGYRGIGRATRTGTDPNFTYTRPTFADETQAARASGRGYKYSLVFGRFENPLFFGSNSDPAQSFTQAQLPGILGQVMRGFPDAANPSASSPFGWFYLPTGGGGAEITSGDTNRDSTRTYGYIMADEARMRNVTANSPDGSGAQPFSADLTGVPSQTLADGRTLNSVYQSRYTEGNNVGISDDRQNDNETTQGVKGYSLNRQFSADYYKYYSSYEFGGVDASGGGTGSPTPVVYPASANPDVYPGAVNLFYFNNVEHDYLYSIGFTEPFWNFQLDNFGKGGAGGDSIIAQVQDGSGTNNANMGTPAEGSNPRMQMFLFTDPVFRRSDGDFDWDVVAHEFYHGVSNRSAAKGGTSCLGTPLVGESGGMGEGWSDFVAISLADDDSEGEYVTGEFDKGIRRIPYTNYRYSYGSINNRSLAVRRTDPAVPTTPDSATTSIPYEVHDVGEVWAATLWDMRELMIMKDPDGVFFDGTKRLGSGACLPNDPTCFYIAGRQVKSIDTNHPINYRPTFMTSTIPTTGPAVPTTVATRDIVRPGLLATENASNPNRNGALATAVSNGGRLSDKIVLRGLQLAPCNPTFVDMRDSMLAADREMTGGENQAITWRAFASHGVGVNATSTGKTNGVGQQGAVAAIVEDYTVPQGVTDCETLGPLAAPTFALTNTAANTVRVTITPVTGAANYVIARSTSANGPFTTIATITGTTYDDNDGGAGLVLGQTYYYQVHATRNQYCVGLGSTSSITVTVGAALSPAPVFGGLGQVADLKTGRSLVLSWSPATSANPGANVVYDIYRVLNVDNSDFSRTPPTFTPGAGNLRVPGVTGTSYTDTGLTLGQQYYYIVQARDTTNGKVDRNNTGNTATKFNAPSTKAVSSIVPFALETFETASADNRFNPPLAQPNPLPTPLPSPVPSMDRSMPVFYRTTADLNGGGTNIAQMIDAPSAVTGLMFAPDYDPANSQQGAASDFFTQINPTGLTRASFLEFDHRFGAEAAFDGGTLEVVLGDPAQVVTPFPNNTTTFDLDDYIVQNGYTGNLDGMVVGAPGSPLLGRRAFTGTKDFSHVKVALGDFAPGGVKNPNSLPVFIRFHMTSDAGSFVDGWYIDNLVVNNFNSAGLEADVNNRPNGDGSVNAGDITIMRSFAAGQSEPDTSGTTSEYQRADCAPRITLGGGGRINAGDLTVARAYAADTSQVQFAGGPTSPSGDFNAASNSGAMQTAESLVLGGLLAKQKGRGAVKSGDSSANLTAPNAPAAAPTVTPVFVSRSGSTLTVGLILNSGTPQVNAVGFTLNYNTAQVSNPTNVRVGSAASSNGSTATLSPTNNSGQLGILLDFPQGVTYNTGNQQIALVDFTVATGATQANFTFGDMPTERYISEVTTGNKLNVDNATSFPATTISTSVPTAAPASISGQVINPNGTGLAEISIKLFDPASGQTFYATTDEKGNYRFTDIPVGQDYIITPVARGYTFNPSSRFISLTEDLTVTTFTANRSRKSSVELR